MSAERKKILLGESLIKDGLLSEQQLQSALEEQRRTGDFLGAILVRKKHITEERLARFLSEHLGVEYVDLTSFVASAQLAGLVPEEFARKFGTVPLEKKPNLLVVAIGNPKDIVVIDELRRQLGIEIEPRLATISGINRAMEKLYGSKSQLKGLVNAVNQEKISQNLEFSGSDQVNNLEDLTDDALTVQFLDRLLVDAVNDKASDIHIEPAKDQLMVRFRIDGLLKDIIQPPKHMHEPIVSRIKVMSNLDIAEKRLPQDGKFERMIGGGNFDVRVSTLPSINGEKVVLRVLNRSSLSLSIQSLGLDPDELQKLTSLINKTHGIIFVTGPTGSGKTTTLYSILETIKSREKNIVTIEDPVEYELSGITQAQINTKAGINFSLLLRAIVRQDPDIILVGETRDKETAEVAIRAAMTGHLVFSTLHTNDAPGAIMRLVDMGVEPFLIASSTVGVIAQRLMREICPSCRQQESLDPDLATELGIPASTPVFKGKGCEHCLQTGYRGRIPVFEILMIDDDIRDMVTHRTSGAEFKKSAREKGMKTLRQAALDRALSGKTSIQEVIRVTEKD